MRFLALTIFLSFIYCVASKNNVKSLTESLGQEVIEIGAPSKDLPPGLEEEPSAENEDDEKHSTNTILPVTKKDIKKTVTLPETRRKLSKDIDKIDGVGQEDEEARIEKELAEIYKDSADYKADNSEAHKELETTTKTIEDVEKPVERSKTNFKFQPDIDNQADVERFRTSVDEITCDKRVTQKLADESTNSATMNITNLSYIFIILIMNMC